MPIQPSRPTPNPKGFRDGTLTDPARASAALHAKLRVTNPNIKKLVENVRFHPSLKQDEVTFQSMWADKFYPLNAHDFGSPSSRPRQYMADFVALGDIPTVTPLSPNSLLSPGRHCRTPQMPCIVASHNTHSVPSVYDTHTGLTSRLSAVECEVIQGWPPGITGGVSTPLHTTYATRLRQVGNALNAPQLYYILRNYAPISGTAQVYPAPATFPSPGALEAHLSTLTDAGLRQWMARRTEG